MINECLSCIRLVAEIERLHAALRQINNINERASIFHFEIYEIIRNVFQVGPTSTP
jgi:hypothetical protein